MRINKKVLKEMYEYAGGENWDVCGAGEDPEWVRDLKTEMINIIESPTMGPSVDFLCEEWYVSKTWARNFVRKTREWWAKHEADNSGK